MIIKSNWGITVTTLERRARHSDPYDQEPRYLGDVEAILAAIPPHHHLGMVIPTRSSRSRMGSTTSFTIGTIWTKFWVPRLDVPPSSALPVDALASWCPRKSTSSPLMIIAL